MEDTMKRIMLVLIISNLVFIPLFAIQVKDGDESSKMLDLSKIHNISEFQLRTSNYCIIGSGNDIAPPWPSLEFPKDTQIDYLYICALWFGASKQRRNEFGEILYWQNPNHEQTGTTNMGFGRVIDTLTTVGFDGDADMHELLPAYNLLEEPILGDQYYQYNLLDKALKFYSSDGVLNIDDDGDGLIDEDPIGMIGFPTDPDSIFCFAMPYDDDGDGLLDEDGGYYGAENILSYSYDYSPFGTPGHRVWGGWTFGQQHTPLNISVKQESFCWPADSIAQIVLIKNTIYNMNHEDTLYDYTLGYFFDCDIGPQSWTSDERSNDDVSSYFIGSEYEFPYSYDHDGDGGLSEGYVAVRIFSLQDSANYTCWTWERGSGPHDGATYTQWWSRNQKYWLMTDRNPDHNKFTSLKDFPNTQINDPCDTRFLNAVYGDMNGFTAPTDSSFNIAPGDSAVIYAVIFLGYSYENMLDLAEIIQKFYETGFDLAFVHDYYPSLIISEYIEGSSQNKVLEIYNGTGSVIDLENYRISQSINGGGWQYYHNFPVNAILATGDVWVITTDEADAQLQSVADEILSYPSVVHFNGNDARGLEKTCDNGQSWELIDVIGIPSEDPGDGWSVAGTPDATKDHTLVRKNSVFKGNIDWTSSAGTNSEDSEWIVYPQDTFEYLGFHAEGGTPPTTFVNTTQGNIDSCRTGSAIHFNFLAYPFAAYFKYRLVYYERIGTDSLIVQWNEDAILDSTEWNSTEEYIIADEVLLMAEYPDGNPYGKPYLRVNEFDEVTQLQVKAVNYTGIEDSTYAKMTFFVRGYFTPETCPFMISWSDTLPWSFSYGLDTLPHIYILGEYTYLTYLSNPEEIPFEVVSGEYHYANQFYMDINEDLSAIWSDDIEIYMKWSYLGEYEYNPGIGVQYAGNTYSYDENLDQYFRYYCDIEFMDIQLDGCAENIPPIGTVIMDSISGEEWMRVPISVEQACTLINLPSGSHIFKVRAVDYQGAVDPIPESLEFTLHERIEAEGKTGILVVDDTYPTYIFALEDSVDIFYDNLLDDFPEEVITFDLNEESFQFINELNKDIRLLSNAPYFAPSDIQQYKLIIWHSNNPKHFFCFTNEVHLIQHYDLLSFYLDSGGNLVFSGCARILDPDNTQTNFLQDYAGFSDSTSSLNGIFGYWGTPTPENSIFIGANGVADFTVVDTLHLNLHICEWPNGNYFPEYFPPITYLGAIGNVTFLELENGEPIFTSVPSSLPEHQIFDGACVGSKYIKEPGVTGITYVLGFPLYYIQLDDAVQFIDKVFADIDSLWSIDEEDFYTYNSNIILPNYPNPMRSETTISFSIHQRDIKDAKIKIYNLKGQIVKCMECVESLTTSEGSTSGGKVTESLYSISWDGTDKNNRPVSSGIYFYRLEIENYESQVKKLLLLR